MLIATQHLLAGLKRLTDCLTATILMLLLQLRRSGHPRTVQEQTCSASSCSSRCTACRCRCRQRMARWQKPTGSDWKPIWLLMLPLMQHAKDWLHWSPNCSVKSVRLSRWNRKLVCLDCEKAENAAETCCDSSVT